MLVEVAEWSISLVGQSRLPVENDAELMRSLEPSATRLQAVVFSICLATVPMAVEE